MVQKLKEVMQGKGSSETIFSAPSFVVNYLNANLLAKKNKNSPKSDTYLVALEDS